MKLWKRASGLLKDQRSLLKASLTPRSTLRNPNIETAVIKATNHDESRVDYHSVQRVFAWAKISDDCLYSVLLVLFKRMKRTHNWVVVLKGLMILHGVFCCKVPGIQQIGQLSPDLLNVKDKHRKLHGLNTFICSYYVFLDQKSSFIFLHSQEQRKRRAVLPQDVTSDEQNKKLMIQDFIWLQKLQGLLDMLLEIQPRSGQTVNVLVLEAMDCVVIELYDIHGRISNGIRTVLMSIYSLGENEAKIVLSILQKARVQHEKVFVFFEFCKDIGVRNASECPNMEQIPDKVVRELEDTISGDSGQLGTHKSPKEEVKSIISVEQNKLTKTHEHNNSMSSLKTTITNDWEDFSKQDQKPDLIGSFSPPPKNNTRFDPLIHKTVEFPDLIRF